MKVLLVHNSYQEPGGEDTVFEQERTLLERAGHQVILYARSNSEVLEISAWNRLTLVRRLIWAEDSRRQVEEILHREKPDLTHIHNTFFMISPSIYDACQNAGVPVVQTLHNFRLFCPAANFYRHGHVCEECLEHSLWRGIGHGCYRGSRSATAGVALMLKVHRKRRTWTEGVDGYVALSEFARQKFVASGIPANKISVKPNFVDRDPGGHTGEGDYALFVGRLSGEKGLQTMISAWQGLSLPLKIVGDGPLSIPLRDEVSRRHISSVSFCGRLKRDETLQMMKAARFIVVPSECYENFPVVIAEAFACGTPAIGSRIGSIPELVRDGKTGLHFSPGDPLDLRRKAHWAWTHPDQISEMGKQARCEYESCYTPEKNYPLLMEIYRRAMDNHA